MGDGARWGGSAGLCEGSAVHFRQLVSLGGRLSTEGSESSEACASSLGEICPQICLRCCFGELHTGRDPGGNPT